MKFLEEIKIEDLKVGDKFNSLTFTGGIFIGKNYQKLGNFICDCGKETVRHLFAVLRWETETCGCYKTKQKEERLNLIIKQFELFLLSYDQSHDNIQSLSITSKSYIKGSKVVVDCSCICGNTRTVDVVKFMKGDATACVKCIHKEILIKRNTSHNESGTALYKRWCGLVTRCCNPNSTHYDNYGGRGISLFCQWKNSYEKFRDWALQNGWNEELHIDRIDNNGGYFPNNVRFVTPTVNANNKRNTKFIQAFGETKNVTDWLEDERCIVTRQKIYDRFWSQPTRKHWTNEELLTIENLPKNVDGRQCKIVLKAFGEEKSVYEWSLDDRCNTSANNLRDRIRTNKTHSNEELISFKKLPKSVQNKE